MRSMRKSLVALAFVAIMVPSLATAGSGQNMRAQQKSLKSERKAIRQEMRTNHSHALKERLKANRAQVQTLRKAETAQAKARQQAKLAKGGN